MQSAYRAYHLRFIVGDCFVAALLAMTSAVTCERSAFPACHAGHERSVVERSVENLPFAVCCPPSTVDCWGLLRRLRWLAMIGGFDGSLPGLKLGVLAPLWLLLVGSS